MFWEEDEDSDGNPPSEWPEWKIQRHLRYCCKFCKDPDTFEAEQSCAVCQERACEDCVRGCDDCEEAGCLYSENFYCNECRAKELTPTLCGKYVCADAMECIEYHSEELSSHRHGCVGCYEHHCGNRQALVREVERCLLLSLKGRVLERRAGLCKTLPMATRVLDRLARESKETLASVVLGFSVEGRPHGPRRRRKLVARKSTGGKVPRKQLATKAYRRAHGQC